MKIFPWFKFYGQDWLTDLKIIRLRPQDRLVYLTLLCLASTSDERGKIMGCEEIYIIELTHLYGKEEDEKSDFGKARGCLRRFEQMGMITMITNDNGTDVIINAFQKRQDSNLSSYERVKRFREKNKNSKSVENKGLNRVISSSNDNVINDNVRVEESRGEKIREERELKYPTSYLKGIPKEDIKEFTSTYEVSESQVNLYAEKILTYCKQHGKKYKDYKAALRSWIMKDFKKISSVNIKL